MGTASQTRAVSTAELFTTRYFWSQIMKRNGYRLLECSPLDRASHMISAKDETEWIPSPRDSYAERFDGRVYDAPEVKRNLTVS